MKRIRDHFAIAAVLAAFVAAGSGAPAAQDLAGRVKAKTLANGLTVILVERHGAPVFSAIYGFKVGSVDELPGITGTAHLFEHMAFKGTPKIGTSDYEKERPVMDEVNRVGRELSLEIVKGDRADPEKVKSLRERLAALEKEQSRYIVKDEIDQIYNNAGGVELNAGTGTDSTQYVISLPSNRLELFCAMESERIRNAVLREFYTERSVIQEERKQTTEAVPARLLSEIFMGAAFLAHPYKNPVVGWASDIASVTLEEAAAFKAKYYTPNNCVLAIVGDVRPETAFPLIERYFGDIPRGEEPPVLRTVEPKQVGERRVTLEFAAEPRLLMGFHTPPFPSADNATATVVANILSLGRTSRLYRDLVQTKQLAANVSVGAARPGMRYGNLIMVSAVPRFPHTNAEVEAAVEEHLERLKAEPVGEKELQKVKNNIAAGYVRSMASDMGLASTLLRYQLLFGDWKLYLKAQYMYDAVTAEDVMRFANAYFTAENRTVASLVKKAAR
jgi:predicted Zn-dependent peptidase